MARTGQFKKGGGRVGDGRHAASSRSKPRRRRPPSKGLTIVENVRSPAPIVKVVRVPAATTVRRAKRTGGGQHTGRHHRNAHAIVLQAHGAGELVPGPFRLRSAAIAGAIGYADGGKGLTAVKDMLDKLPTVGKLPKEVLAGLALNYFADRGDWFDAGAQALIDVGAYKLGQAGFALSGEDEDY
jgi:hypothetical protein